MTLQTVLKLKAALADYAAAVMGTSHPEDMADYQRLISITEQIIAMLEIGTMQEARLLTLAFSRCVTDSFAEQPREYQRLSEVVRKIK